MTIRPLGWATIGIGALATAVGLVLGWAAVTALGVSLLVVAATAALWLGGRGGADITLRLPTDRVVVGEHAEFAVDVVNRTGRRLPSHVVEVDVAGAPVRVRMPSLAGRERTSVAGRLPTERRGRITVGPVRIVRRDPVGLYRREGDRASVLDLLVRPRTAHGTGSAAGTVRDLEGRAAVELTTSDLSFHALRDYLPGDDRRSIHWRSTARTGAFMVRQFEQTRRSRVAIVLTADGGTEGDEGYELAVSVAVSAAIDALRSGDEVTLHTVDAESRPVQVPGWSPGQLLDAAALVEPGRGGLRQAVRTAAPRLADATTVILVGAGEERSPARLTPLLPTGASILAIGCRPGAIPSAGRHGTLSLVTVGYLDDLPRALRRIA